MKTYLIRNINEDGTSRLEIATRIEFEEIINANKCLPLEQKRLFIKEIDFINGEEDTMFIEVGLSEYRKWNSQNTMNIRNYKNAKEFIFCSINDEINSEGITLEEIIPSKENVETEFKEKYLMQSLQVALEDWKPYGVEMLDYYLKKQSRSCTKILAMKYGVSEVTIRTWKKDFEIFIKKFLF